MKKIIFAAAALTLGLGAYAVPAFAQADDYGQHVYTQNEQSRFAPEGLAAPSTGDFRATIDFGAREISRNTATRQGLNDRLDRNHSQW